MKNHTIKSHRDFKHWRNALLLKRKENLEDLPQNPQAFLFSSVAMYYINAHINGPKLEYKDKIARTQVDIAVILTINHQISA